MDVVNFGKPYVVIYGIPISKWCETYELRVFSVDCECGAKITANIPWADKYRRGIKGEKCACGANSVPFSFIDIRCKNGEVPLLVD